MSPNEDMFELITKVLKEEHGAGMTHDEIRKHIQNSLINRISTGIFGVKARSLGVCGVSGAQGAREHRYEITIELFACVSERELAKAHSGSQRLAIAAEACAQIERQLLARMMKIAREIRPVQGGPAQAGQTALEGGVEQPVVIEERKAIEGPR